MGKHRRVDQPLPFVVVAYDRAPEKPHVDGGTPAPSAPISASEPLRRLKLAFARSKKAFQARHVDLNSAVSQHSRYGRSSSPSHFTRHDHERDTPHVYAAPALPKHAKPRKRSGQLVTAAIARVRAPQATRQQEASVGKPAKPALWISDSASKQRDVLARAEQVFTSSSGYAKDIDALAFHLYDIASTGETPSVAASRALLLIEALREAGATETASADDTLWRIGQLDFDRPHTRVFADHGERRAWHVVNLLARSSGGFSILERLRVNEGMPFANDMHRLALKTLLESAAAADYSEEELHARSIHDYSPGAIAARMGLLRQSRLAAIEPGPTALAKRAFDAAVSLLEDGPDSLTADQCGALFAWRQGFREDNRGSDLAQARERLYKFLTQTIPRVEEPRWKSRIPRVFRGTSGSALSALRLGTRGVPRKTIAHEQAALRDKMAETQPDFDRSIGWDSSSVLAHAHVPRKMAERATKRIGAQYDDSREGRVRETMRQAMWRLMRMSAMRPSAMITHARAQQSVLELAALQIWLERGGFANGRPNAAALAAIAKRAREIAEQLAASSGTGKQSVRMSRKIERMLDATAQWQSRTGEELVDIKPFSRIARRSFSIERLAAWGKVAGVPDDDAFWPLIEELMSLAHPSTSVKDAQSIDGVHATLKEVVEGLQSGHRLHLSDGGHQGISTRGLSGSTQLFINGTALPISPRLDVRALRTRAADVVISRTTHCAEIFAGTTETRQRHFGAGLLVGYDIDVDFTVLRAGIVTNVTLHGRELSQPRGVSIRVARRLNADGTGYDDKAMQAKLSEIVDHFFAEAQQAHDDGPNGVWNRFAQRYWADPDVSVSWTESETVTRRHGLTVDANATVALPKFGAHHPSDPGELTFRAGPSIGAGWQRSRQTMDSVERTGMLQVEQHRVSLGASWQARTGIAPSVAHPVSSNGRHSVGLMSIDAPALSMKLDERNQSAKVQLVWEGGDKLNHRACVLDIEYLNADAYMRSVQSSRGELLRLFSAQASGAGKHGQDRSVSRREKIARAGQRIDAHLADVDVNRGPHLSYVKRYRLRREVAEQLEANAMLVAQSGHDLRVKAAFEARKEQLLGNRASWMLVELKVRERNTRARSFGPSMMLQFNTRMSATGDREIVAENAPFNALEALDGPSSGS